MSILRILLIIFLVFSVTGGAAWNWKQSSEIVHREGMEAEAAAQTMRDQKLLHDAKERIKALRVEVESSQIQLHNRSAEENHFASAAIAPRSVFPKNSASNINALEELKKFTTLGLETAYDQNYATLFKQLRQDSGATPDTLRRLKQLLVQKQLDQDQSINPLNRGGAISPQDIAHAEEPVGQQIEEILGQDGYSRFLEYQKTLPQRNTVELVARTLDYNATPLNTFQVEQLMGMLTPFPAQGSGVPSAALLNAPTDLVPVTDQAIAAAATMFSPEQIRALHEVQLQQQTQEKLFRWLGQLQHPRKVDDTGRP